MKVGVCCSSLRPCLLLSTWRSLSTFCCVGTHAESKSEPPPAKPGSTAAAPGGLPRAPNSNDSDGSATKPGLRAKDGPAVTERVKRRYSVNPSMLAAMEAAAHEEEAGLAENGAGEHATVKTLKRYSSNPEGGDGLAHTRSNPESNGGPAWTESMGPLSRTSSASSAVSNLSRTSSPTLSVDEIGLELVTEQDLRLHIGTSQTGNGSGTAAAAKAAGMRRLEGLRSSSPLSPSGTGPAGSFTPALASIADSAFRDSAVSNWDRIAEEEDEELLRLTQRSPVDPARAARVKALAEGPTELSRVVPARIGPDPKIMARQYDEQYVHPMDDRNEQQEKLDTATATWYEMDFRFIGKGIAISDFKRVFVQDREDHVFATRAMDDMAAKKAEEKALRASLGRHGKILASLPIKAARHAPALLPELEPQPEQAPALSPASPGGSPKKMMKKPKNMMKKPPKTVQVQMQGTPNSSDDEKEKNGRTPDGPTSSSSPAPPPPCPAVQETREVAAPLPEMSDREMRKCAISALRALKVAVDKRTQSQQEKVIDWVRSVPFFRTNAPSEEAMLEIANEVTCETYTISQDIITQGDKGDAFYAILMGVVDAIVDGQGTVGQLTVPSTFGDRALEDDDGGLRAATIRASTGEVVVAKLTAERYFACIARVQTSADAAAKKDEGHENSGVDDSIRAQDFAAALVTMSLPLENRSTVQNRNLEEWVGTIQFFKMNAKTGQHRVEIAKSLQTVYVEDGEDVFLQGDIGDALFCVMQGEVDIIVDGNSVGALGFGQCFGDRALEVQEGDDPEKRAAGIRAIGDITLARLSADQYHACIDRVIMAASATPRMTRLEGDVEHMAAAAADHPLSVISGLTKEERIALGGCETFNGARVLVAQSWVTQAVVRRRLAGGLAVDPPVLATGVYRNFQSSNDAYYQCKKIVDTPFPYPYAQAVMLMLCLYTIIAPFMICQIVNSTPWAVVTSAITVGAFVTMNEVARGLEEPFGHDANQIAVDDLHMDFNEKLWCLTQKVYKK